MSKTTKSIWLRRAAQLSLAGTLVFPLSLSGADAPDDSGTRPHMKFFEARNKDLVKFFENLETARREAMSKAGNGQYQDAVKELEALLKSLQDKQGDMAVAKTEELKNNILRIQRVWSSDLMQTAQNLAKEKKYQDAINKAQVARSLTPSREYIGNFISECQKYLDAAKYSNEVSLESVSPDYAKRQKEIELDLRDAKLFIRNKRYESASTRLERVLLVDPFNIEAIDLLAIVYDRIYKAGLLRSSETTEINNARSMWEWVEPLAKVQVDHTTNRSGTPRQRSNSDLYNRLERIVFPMVPLKAATVRTAIRYLDENSRKYDPDKQGVTIIDNLSPQEKERPISLDLGETPLIDVIRYLSMTSGLPYTFRDGRVVFGNVDTMSTEYFPVRGEIISEIIDSQISRPTSSGMKSVEESGGDGAPAGDAPEAESNDVDAAKNNAATASSTAAETQRNSAALKAYFSERWVTFENGANIIYSPRGERLMVRNTAENLRRMDALLRQLDALEQPMIMVEAKLIELTDTNLNELGFEWMFSASRTAGNKWSLGVVDPTRHGGGEGMFRVLNNLRIFPNFGEKIFGSDLNVDLSLSINAVAQNRSAEVLASPRILSESGPKKPAMIKMTEKTYFITEWEEPDVETDGFNISLDSTDPEWDDAVDLGVTFSVQPTVNADNYTITLNNIKPIFLTHVQDHDYIVTYEAGQYIDGAMVPVMTQTFNLKMPEIARREMETNITLYDGETVLLGGMADNEVSNRDDRWPILGDIPFLGNFFRDQQTKVVNRTLLIFLTARLINPNGVPLRNARERGLIDFNR